jgi:hypothetical protein
MAKSTKGFVYLWRDIVESPLWDNGKPFSEGQAWMQFIMWAEYKQNTTQLVSGQMISLQPGEFMMTQRKIAQSLNWSYSAVNRFLKKLIALNQIRINSESKMTRVNLVNYRDKQFTESKTNQDKVISESTAENPNNSNSYYNNYNIINNNNKSNNKKNNKDNNYNSIDSPMLKVGVVQSSSLTEKQASFKSKPRDVEMVIDYFKKQKIEEPISNGSEFFAYYDSIGWYRGKSKIKDWKKCVVTWKKNINNFSNQTPNKSPGKFMDQFKKSAAGGFIAYCSKDKHGSICGNQEFPKDAKAIYQGSHCCKSSYLPNRPKKEQIYEESKRPQNGQAGAQKSTTRGRTTERGSELFQSILDNSAQQR